MFLSVWMSWAKHNGCEIGKLVCELAKGLALIKLGYLGQNGFSPAIYCAFENVKMGYIQKTSKRATPKKIWAYKMESKWAL